MAFAKLGKDDLMFLAKTAEEADATDLLLDVTKVLVKQNQPLSEDARVLLTIAYKSKVGQHRSGWKNLKRIEKKDKGKKDISAKTAVIAEKIAADLKALCKEFETLVDTQLLPKEKDARAKLYYEKSKADHCRYLAELYAGKPEIKEITTKVTKIYQEVCGKAKELDALDSIRLGAALNYGVFLNDILNDNVKAMQILKEAMDVAEKKWASLDAKQRNEKPESAMMLGLIRQNLKRWANAKGGSTSFSDDDEGDDV